MTAHVDNARIPVQLPLRRGYGGVIRRLPMFYTHLMTATLAATGVLAVAVPEWSL